MNGKINKDGNLEIERAGKMLVQLCPHQQATEYRSDSVCGHWCPLFKEPEEDYSDHIKLKLCHATLWFHQFTDERNQENSPYLKDTLRNLVKNWETDAGFMKGSLNDADVISSSVYSICARELKEELDK